MSVVNGRTMVLNDLQEIFIQSNHVDFIPLYEKYVLAYELLTEYDFWYCAIKYRNIECLRHYAWDSNTSRATLLEWFGEVIFMDFEDPSFETNVLGMHWLFRAYTKNALNRSNIEDFYERAPVWFVKTYLLGQELPARYLWELAISRQRTLYNAVLNNVRHPNSSLKTWLQEEALCRNWTVLAENEATFSLPEIETQILEQLDWETLAILTRVCKQLRQSARRRPQYYFLQYYANHQYGLYHIFINTTNRYVLHIRNGVNQYVMSYFGNIEAILAIRKEHYDDHELVAMFVNICNNGHMVGAAKLLIAIPRMLYVVEHSVDIQMGTIGRFSDLDVIALIVTIYQNKKPCLCGMLYRWDLNVIQYCHSKHILGNSTMLEEFLNMCATPGMTPDKIHWMMDTFEECSLLREGAFVESVLSGNLLLTRYLWEGRGSHLPAENALARYLIEKNGNNYRLVKYLCDRCHCHNLPEILRQLEYQTNHPLLERLLLKID